MPKHSPRPSWPTIGSASSETLWLNNAIIDDMVLLGDLESLKASGVHIDTREIEDRIQRSRDDMRREHLKSPATS